MKWGDWLLVVFGFALGILFASPDTACADELLVRFAVEDDVDSVYVQVMHDTDGLVFFGEFVFAGIPVDPEGSWTIVFDAPGVEPEKEYSVQMFAVRDGLSSLMSEPFKLVIPVMCTTTVISSEGGAVVSVTFEACP